MSDGGGRAQQGPAGDRGYRAAIEVEEDRATPTATADLAATADLEAIALEFAAKHPERGQESLYTLYHSQKPAVRIPKKLFTKKTGL